MAILFDMDYSAGAAPGAGFGPGDANEAEDGFCANESTHTQTRVAGGGPSGQDAYEMAVLYDGGAGNFGGQFNYGWHKQALAPAPTYGSERYFRWRYQITADSNLLGRDWSSGSNSDEIIDKIIIVNDGCGANCRPIISIESHASTGDYYVRAQKDGGGDAVDVGDFSPGTWINIQIRIRWSSSSGAANGGWATWINNDNAGSPDAQFTTTVLNPTANPGMVRFGFFQNHGVRSGGVYKWRHADFEIGDTFESWDEPASPPTALTINKAETITVTESQTASLSGGSPGVSAETVTLTESVVVQLTPLAHTVAETLTLTEHTAAVLASPPVKLYLLAAAPLYTPATIRGAWDDTAGVVTGRLDRVPQVGGVITTVTRAESSTTDEFDVLLYRGVSGPLAAQTISGTLDVRLGVWQSSGAGNFCFHLHAYVTQGDSDTPRGTLLSDYREAVAQEWSTFTAGNVRTLAAAQTLTPLAVTAGDRLVVEIGYTARNVSATAFTGNLRYGAGRGLPDLEATPTDSRDGNPSISLPLGLLAAVLETRISQLVVEVLTPFAADLELTVAVFEAITTAEDVTASLASGLLLADVADSLALSESLTTDLLIEMVVAVDDTITISESVLTEGQLTLDITVSDLVRIGDAYIENLGTSRIDIIRISDVVRLQPPELFITTFETLTISEPSLYMQADGTVGPEPPVDTGGVQDYWVVGIV